MTQIHFEQQGIFHVTTNAKGKIPWLTWKRIPEMLIDNLRMTKNLYRAEVFAFCILPDHMHVVLRPGEKGLSRLMQSFKSQSMRDLRVLRPPVKECLAESRGSPLNIPLPVASPIAWQKGFHSEQMESGDQYENALRYVRFNAWRHCIVDDPKDWQWSSIHFQAWMDPVEIW